jgi:mannan endo-1,4-beta-mannosidase
MARLLVSILFASLGSGAVLSPRGENQHGIDPGDFVAVDGLRFKDSKGGTHYLTGLNYWACMNLAADDSVGGNYSRLTTELDQMAAKGVNHLRIMASSEGAPTPQPFRMNPPLLEEPGKYNAAIFAGLDRCLDEMSKRGMRATMTLGDEWQWSGGFGQFVSWAQNNTQIPYPPSWNMSAPPQREIPGTGWGNYTVIGVDAAPWHDFQNFANLMYSTPQAEQWYKDHIKAVINRKNTINGRVYKEDATIMTWQLANEPQAQAPLGYEGPYGMYLVPNAEDLLFPWIDRISTYIRGLAPKQLINVGLEGKQGQYYFQQAHNFTTVDYATTHCKNTPLQVA